MLQTFHDARNEGRLFFNQRALAKIVLEIINGTWFVCRNEQGEFFIGAVARVTSRSPPPP